jgi:hypothetical protein
VENLAIIIQSIKEGKCLMVIKLSVIADRQLKASEWTVMARVMTTS